MMLYSVLDHSADVAAAWFGLVAAVTAYMKTAECMYI